MSKPRWTLEAVKYGWGDAYLISHTRDHWVALRRDTHQFLTADTLDSLEAVISADYQRQPVPRDFDPPGTAEEMSWPPIPVVPVLDDEAADEQAGDAELNAYGMPSDETLRLLALLRHTFPLWDIAYSATTHYWIARSRKRTLCQNSPAALCIALILIERRARRTRIGLDRNWPPWTQGEAKA